jgi:hypothetical protein
VQFARPLFNLAGSRAKRPWFQGQTRRRRFLSKRRELPTAVVAHDERRGSYCFFLAAVGGAGRASAHGSDFFFSASGSPLIIDW